MVAQKPKEMNYVKFKNKKNKKKKKNKEDVTNVAGMCHLDPVSF